MVVSSKTSRIAVISGSSPGSENPDTGEHVVIAATHEQDFGLPVRPIENNRRGPGESEKIVPNFFTQTRNIWGLWN